MNSETKLGIGLSLPFVGAIIGVIIAFIALTANAADLKCVTIKFKSDSELKLKTQWFVNHCDTAKTTNTFRQHGYTGISITCRTLLFPPDVRREPVIAKTELHYDGFHDEFRYSRNDTLFSESHCDTIPGEALLWYEERRNRER